MRATAPTCYEGIITILKYLNFIYGKINNAEEALALTGKELPDVSEIAFEGFPVSDKIIASLCNFIRNNQNLSSLDLRECLELNNTQLELISTNIREHNHSLCAIAFPMIDTIIGGLGVNIEKKRQQELFKVYTDILKSTNSDFSRSNQMNFSVQIPSKIAEIMKVLLRNHEMTTLDWGKKSVEYYLSEASGAEINPETLIRLFNETKKQEQTTATAAAADGGESEGDEEYVDLGKEDFGVTVIEDGDNPDEPSPTPVQTGAKRLAEQTDQQLTIDN